MKLVILIGMIISFTSCGLIFFIIGEDLLTEEYKGLLDQKYEYCWTGNNNGIDYLLTIDSVQETWFRGKIIINSSDTLFLKGFEKGSNHPTHYKTNLNDTTAIGFIFIWSVGQYTDTVEIKNKSGVHDAIPEELTLIKKRKNLNYFESKRMTQGQYIEGQTSKLGNYDKNETSLKITLHEKVSENFIEHFFDQVKIDDYLANNDESQNLNKDQMVDHLSKFFSVEIINLTSNDYSISNDLGLPIIQEARNKNGEWKPIEYILLNGSILYSTIEIPKKSKIEIAAPRYKGNYETDLRLKIKIQKYGILTSETYKGRINYNQFKKPKSKNLINKIHFLN